MSQKQNRTNRESAKNIEPFSPLLIKLLKEPLYNTDRKNWELLLTYRKAVAAYFYKIGLGLDVYEADGFAYVRQLEDDEIEEENKRPPRLIHRHPLTWEITLMLVLLRERLHQFELSEAADTMLVLTREELREMVTFFFKEKADEIKMLRNIDTIINKTAELGFLRPLSYRQKDDFEVMRILKAKLPAEKLEAIRMKLESHIENNPDLHLEGNNDEQIID